MGNGAIERAAAWLTSDPTQQKVFHHLFMHMAVLPAAVILFQLVHLGLPVSADSHDFIVAFEVLLIQLASLSLTILVCIVSLVTAVLAIGRCIYLAFH